jgi:hypothetical protein
MVYFIYRGRLGRDSMIVKFTTIYAISAYHHSVLLVEETGVPGENHRPVASQRQSLLHNVVSSTPRHERDSNRER